MTQPLSNTRILDLTMNLPGPYMTWLLALLGAEVVKIENPDGGDYGRALTSKTSGSPFFTALNRNKKSVKLNLKNPAGKSIFQELASKSDVIVEGFRPGVMDRLGLGYTDLQAINPGLIYASITGYGYCDDDYKLRAGHDVNYLALSGLLAMIGDEQKKPSIPGIQIADFVGGSMFGTIGILTALIYKKMTGRGQFVDVSMYDGALATATMVYAAVAAGMEKPEPRSMMLNGKYPCYNVYETKDTKFMALGAVEHKFWKNFCNSIGRPDLIGNQYGSPDNIEVVATIFKQKTQAEWIQLFKSVDACCEPVLSLTEVTESSLARNRNLIAEIDGANFLSYPLKFSENILSTTSKAPELGEHNQEFLLAMGFNNDKIKDFEEKGAFSS